MLRDLRSLAAGPVNQAADMTRPPVINHTLPSLRLSASWMHQGKRVAAAVACCSAVLYSLGGDGVHGVQKREHAGRALGHLAEKRRHVVLKY